MRAAIEAISQSESVLQASSIYETDPVGYLDQRAFLNMVIEVETAKEPLDLLGRLRGIEQELHRERTFPNAPRTIGLDLLHFEEVVLDGPELTIPHPRMHEREFVLVPLVEIAVDEVVPTLSRSARELLDALGDVEQVNYWGEF